MVASLTGDAGWKNMQANMKAVGLGLDKDMKRALRLRVKDDVLDPMIERMREAAVARGRQAARASLSLRAAGGERPKITLGAGRSKNARMAVGTEFGAIPAKRTRNYTGANKYGRFKVRARRSTRQFPPTNNDGYWATPTFDAMADWALEQLAEIANDELRRQLRG